MALRIMRAVEGQTGSMLGLKAMANVLSLSSPISGIMDRKDSAPPLVLPEFNHESDRDRINNCSIVGFGFPILSFSGSMELMAVPKRKVSPHKRGIRNGPKALKPIPVIIRCNSGVVAKSSCLTSIVAVEGQESRITQPDEPMQSKKDRLKGG